MESIDLAYDKEMLDMGIKTYVPLKLNTASWLVFGASGSGKSVLVKSLIARISLHISDAKVTVCDGKADDYTFLRDIPNARHYEYLDIAEGLTEFYSEFESRLKGDETRTFRLIVIEEWSSYLRTME